MRTHGRFSSANMFCAALASALFAVTIFPQEVAAEPSAAEILVASKVAMSRPLKYRLISGGVETVVYQKMLPDGSMAILSDTSSQRIKKINIHYGDKNYELYLDHHVAIDMHFVYQELKSQAALVSSMLGGKAAESSKLLRNRTA